MRWNVAAVLLCGVLGCCCRAAAEGIPAARLQTLDGEAVSLPEDVEGKVTVLILAFTQKSAGESIEWEKSVSREFRSDEAVKYYQMPVLAAVPSLFRGMALRSLRSQVPAVAQPHLLPVMADEGAWKSLVQYSSPERAYVVVLDAAGQVAWRGSGPATTDAREQVFAKVRDLARPKRVN